MAPNKPVLKKLDNFGKLFKLQKTIARLSEQQKKKNFIPIGPFYHIIKPSEENKQYYLGKLCAGNTSNKPPDTWRTCKIHFEEDDENLFILFDSTSVIVKLLPRNDLIKEIIIQKIFALHISILDDCVFFHLYFHTLPLPKFSQRVGACVQVVLKLLLDSPLDYDNDEIDTDTKSETVISQLYKDLRKLRVGNSGCENVQNPKLKSMLKPYQSDAVRWMLHTEKKAIENKDELNPLYTVITLRSGTKIYYNKYSGYVDITKPVVNISAKGGILADEMGLGKTVEVLACILQHPKSFVESQDENFEKSPTIEILKKRKSKKNSSKIENRRGGKRIKFQDFSCSVNKHIECICGRDDKKGLVECEDCGKIQHAMCLGFKAEFGSYRCPQCWMNQPLIESGATLIVVPASLKTQWCNEICKHIKGDINVLQYGGSSAASVYPTDLAGYDIVVTTYNILKTELRLSENENKDFSLRHNKKYAVLGSPISRLKWWRLCLDEAQTVEAGTSMVATMAKKLSAHFRWAVTGTPISKDIFDLHGLINYLQLEPYNDRYTFEQVLYKPYIRGQTSPMLKYLSHILWRTSKDEVIDQINIPALTIEEHGVTFSATEQFFYKSEHHSYSKEFLQKITKHNPDVPLSSLDEKSLKEVLTPLLSLRKVCTYPDSTQIRYLTTKKPLKSMKDLLDALISKNTNKCEGFLRTILSCQNGLGGIYLLQNYPEEAIEEYSKIVELYTRFTKEEKPKLAVDNLQVIHAMHNLSTILSSFQANEILDIEVLRRECEELEHNYTEKVTHQTMVALQHMLIISGNITKIQNSFHVNFGNWCRFLINWIVVHNFSEMCCRIKNTLSNSSSKYNINFKDTESLICDLSSWSKNIINFREKASKSIHRLYEHSSQDNFQIVLPKNLVQQAAQCHLNSEKKAKPKDKCLLCKANEHLKAYEVILFAMDRRTESFEDMSLPGSWKTAPQELILKCLITMGKAKNASHELIEDGETHITMLELLKKEFKELRKLWTCLYQQISAQDELRMCKDRVDQKKKDTTKSKVAQILRKICDLEKEQENVHLIHQQELNDYRITLQNEIQQNLELLETNLGTRTYLETLYTQDQISCPICKKVLKHQWSVLPCGHSYCFYCIKALIDINKQLHLQCSVCRSYYSLTDINCVKTGEEQSSHSEDIEVAKNYSSKVQNIVKLIIRLKTEEPDVKIIVFSLWVSVLKYLKEAFENNNISSILASSYLLDAQTKKFKDPDKHITVILLPIHLGSKGLNLTEATHVILTEPLLNANDELQAIGRIHRIGQTRRTVVHKFFMKDTVEESIQKALNANFQNWKDNKVTIGDLMDLFVSDGASTSETGF